MDVWCLNLVLALHNSRHEPVQPNQPDLNLARILILRANPTQLNPPKKSVLAAPTLINPIFEAMSGNTDINLFIFGIFQELLGMDVLHKFNWIRLIARMFEAMAGNFAYASDIHLFINVINGSLALHAGRIFL